MISCRIRGVTVVSFLSLAGSLIFACSVFSTNEDYPGRYDLKNKGSVCFYRSEIGSPDLKISISTGGEVCLATGCTHVQKREGFVEIDTRSYRIKLESHLIAEDISEQRGVCDADCGGAGSIQLSQFQPPAGVYRVILGRQVLGEIRFPMTMNHKCFSSSSPETPVN